MRVALILTALLMAGAAAAESQGKSPAFAAWEAEFERARAELAQELIASGDAHSLRQARFLAPARDSALRVDIETALDAMPIDDAEGAWRAFHRCRTPVPDCDSAAALDALAQFDPDNAWTWLQLAQAALLDGQAEAALQALQQAAMASPSTQLARDSRLVEEIARLLPLPAVTEDLAEEMGLRLGMERAIESEDYRMVMSLGIWSATALPGYQTLTTLCRPDARQAFDSEWQAACLRVAVHIGQQDSSSIGGLIGFRLAEELADDPAEAARWGAALRQERFAQQQLFDSHDALTSRPGETARYISEIFSLGERAAIQALFARLGLPSEAPPDWSADDAEPRG